MVGRRQATREEVLEAAKKTAKVEREVKYELEPEVLVH